MRLIDADRALEIVRDQGRAHPGAYHLTNYATLILQEAPTINLEDLRPKGKWKSYHEADFGWGKWGDECSNCGFRVERGEVEFSLHYCPKCGAKMEG